jgi:hypothetical protein
LKVKKSEIKRQLQFKREQNFNLREDPADSKNQFATLPKKVLRLNSPVMKAETRAVQRIDSKKTLFRVNKMRPKIEKKPKLMFESIFGSQNSS